MCISTCIYNCMNVDGSHNLYYSSVFILVKGWKHLASVSCCCTTSERGNIIANKATLQKNLCGFEVMTDWYKLNPGNVLWIIINHQSFINHSSINHQSIINQFSCIINVLQTQDPVIDGSRDTYYLVSVRGTCILYSFCASDYLARLTIFKYKWNFLEYDSEESMNPRVKMTLKWS